MSIRGTCRITGAAKNTVTKLLVDLGDVCSGYQHQTLVDLPCGTIECDEIWNFVYAKDKNIPADKREKYGVGSVWTWTAICAGAQVDWAVIQKAYSNDISEENRRYSPAVCTGIEIDVRTGNPDRERISTSYVERQNLTMRMNIRRFTRLTNGFSKKIENLAAAVTLHYMVYNFARAHTSLKNPYPCTPAMAAGKADHVWTLREVAALLD